MSVATAIPTIPAQQIFAPDQLEGAAAQAIEFGFAVMHRPGLRSVVRNVDEAWRNFCAQELTHKLKCTVARPDDDPDEGPDNGYVNRYGELVPAGEATKDQKEYWHARPPVGRELRQRLRLTEVDRQLLGATALLYSALEANALRFATAVDCVLPGFAIAAAMATRGDPDPFGHVLRLLHYKKVQTAGEEIAKAHTDRDAITFHVADSRPGLVVSLRGGEQFLVPTIPDTLIAFFGRRMSVRTGGAIKALAHRVVSPVEAGTPGEQRTCQVFFSQVPDDFKRFNPQHKFN